MRYVYGYMYGCIYVCICRYMCVYIGVYVCIIMCVWVYKKEEGNDFEDEASEVRACGCMCSFGVYMGV